MGAKKKKKRTKTTDKNRSSTCMGWVIRVSSYHVSMIGIEEDRSVMVTVTVTVTVMVMVMVGRSITSCTYHTVLLLRFVPKECISLQSVGVRSPAMLCL